MNGTIARAERGKTSSRDCMQMLDVIARKHFCSLCFESLAGKISISVSQLKKEKNSRPKIRDWKITLIFSLFKLFRLHYSPFLDIKSITHRLSPTHIHTHKTFANRQRKCFLNTNFSFSFLPSSCHHTHIFFSQLSHSHSTAIFVFFTSSPRRHYSIFPLFYSCSRKILLEAKNCFAIKVFSSDCSPFAH